MRWIALPAAALMLASCAHRKLAGPDLDRVVRPAFVSWIEDGAGPRSEVFRGDPVYRARLKKLEPREADRRLSAKLQKGITRFEVSDRLRSGTLRRLPREAPWTRVVDASKVASLFGTFLVEEVPSTPPDVEELRQLGVDAVVEFIISAYGMRSAGGKAGAYVEGEARMSFLGGGEIWKMPFRVDQVAQGTAALDPFEVAKDQGHTLFREQLGAVLDQVAEAAAGELQPEGRAGGRGTPPGQESSGDALPPPGELE